MWKRKESPTRLQRRIAAMATADLYSWADSSMFALGRSLTAWQRHGNPDDLQDAVAAVEALGALVSEMTRRIPSTGQRAAGPTLGTTQ